MRRVEHLIRTIRRHTDNEQLGSDSGLSDEEIIQFLNDGQDDIYQAIIKTFRKTFATSYKFDSVANQEEYSIPTDMFQSSVITLEYSHSGQEKDYYPLRRRELIEQTTIPGAPLAYMIRANKIIVNPYPQTAITNAFRVRYNKVVPALDKRRTTVASVTVNGSNVITALTLTSAYTGFDADHYLENDYLTTVDFDGTVKCTAIGYGSVAANGVVTFTGAPTKTLLTGESISAGQYVCLGKYSSTHSALFNDCERYLIAYGVWKALKRDSSQDYQAQEAELATMRREIIDSYGETYQDVDQIPIINSDYSEYL